MNCKPLAIGLVCIASMTGCQSMGNLQANSAPPAPEKPVSASITQPSHDTSISVEYAKVVAAQAYVWGWPMVNQSNRRAGITQAPHPALLNGVLPVANQGRIAMLHDYIDPAETFVTCPNQDVVYGLGFYALNSQPVVIQVPDFKDRFWVYAIYDHRTDQAGKLGKPYDTKPGFYLLVGPTWKGTKPEGIEAIIRSPTDLANIIPRVFMDDTAADRAAIQPLINQINVYPLDEFDGKMKTMDWAKLPSIPGPTSSGETKWVVPEKFFDQLKQVLDEVPPLPGEEAMYANYRALLAAADRNPKIKQALIDTAKATEEDVIKGFFRWENNGKPAGQGWNRSVNNAEWGIDYAMRSSTAKSNMFDNRPSETQYFYTDHDSQSQQLSGSGSYSITFKKGQLPPIKGFWSLTLYNDKHLFAPNPLKRYSLGTKNKNLKYNQDGFLTLYAGHKTPGKEKESNWLPAPAGEFSLYIRAYWGEQAILDGTWTPPEVKKI